MAGQKKPLFMYFEPEEYWLDKSKDIWSLKIIGRKNGPPSHRITLHQKNLNILSATIQRNDKQTQSFTVDRINHLPSIDQVRLHTQEIQYPGRYQVNLTYVSKNDKAQPGRELMPSVDEDIAWEKATLEIKP